MKEQRIDIIKKIYEKYKLTDKLPLEAKRVMLKSKKAVFINVLKKQKKYSIFMLFVVSVFFWVKKFGLTISLIKSFIFTAIVSAAMVATISVGSYYGVKKIIKNPAQIEKTKEKAVPEVIEKTPGVSQTPVKKAINYQLNIVPFEYEGIADESIKSLESKIVNNLNKIMGKNSANLISRSKKSITAKKIVLGSVAKVDQNYFITIKVMNPESSKVLLYINEDIDQVDQVDQVCSKIAKKLAANL